MQRSSMVKDSRKKNRKEKEMKKDANRSGDGNGRLHTIAQGDDHVKVVMSHIT